MRNVRQEMRRPDRTVRRPNRPITAGWRAAFTGSPQAGAAEAENIRKEARWKRYGVAFADRGPMERDYYRQRAEVHRAGRAARRAWWPLQLALFAGMGVAIWKGFDLLEPQVQERHSGRGR